MDPQAKTRLKMFADFAMLPEVPVPLAPGI